MSYYEDGETITKGSLGGAMVGGALFGGVGAIVGSGMGSKTKQEISEYRIKIVTKIPFLCGSLYKFFNYW